MPVKYIESKIKWPVWAGPRYQRLDLLERFLEGSIYDHLEYPFYQEVKGLGNSEYIPLRDRRPSVIYKVAKIVVRRSVGMLFGDKHWPKAHTADEETTKYIGDLIEESNLKAAMLEAAYFGSLGSVALMFKIVKKKIFYEVWNPKFCMPTFDDERELDTLFVMYPVEGYELKAIGFPIKDEDLEAEFFYAKQYTKEEEIVYNPIKTDEYDPIEQPFVKNDERSFRHDLGFVPGVWIRNFSNTNKVDAPATFEDIKAISVEIDYQLSQCGRGLKYNSDPQLLIKEPPGGNESTDGQLGLFDAVAPKIRSTSNTLVVGAEGDAKLLEISGEGQKAVLEFVDKLRNLAFEIARSAKKDPDKSYGNISGRAMEILDEELIGLAAELRISYGDCGLKPLLYKLLAAAKKAGLTQVEIDPQDPKDTIQFIWGNWFDPTPADHVQEEQAITAAVEGRRLFMWEARMLSARRYGVGHSQAAEMEKQWPIPPMPEIASKNALAMGGGGAEKGKESGVNSSEGDGRRAT